jgi:hypothetical protein
MAGAGIAMKRHTFSATADRGDSPVDLAKPPIR